MAGFIILFGLVYSVVGSQLARETQIFHRLRSRHHHAIRELPGSLPKAAEDQLTAKRPEQDASPVGTSPSSIEAVHHHSVFTLNLAAVDSPTFWKIFFVVVLITACVERAQSFAYWLAEENRTLEKFVDSVSRELMMFGCVAVSVFLFTNLFGSMSAEMYSLFELVDLVVSLAGWALIIIAAIFVGWSNIRRNQWLALHTGLSTDQSEIEVFSSLSYMFKQRMKLKPDFLFHWYLDECLAFNGTAVMVAEWKVWLLFLIWPAVGLTARLCIGHSMTDDQFLNLLTILNWTSFTAHSVVASWINYHYYHLREAAALDSDVTVRFNEHAAEAMLVALQFMSLCNTFLLAFFLMAGLYNNLFLHTGVPYIILQALPLVIVAAYVYPTMLCRFTVIQGFHCPHPEVIGYVLDQDKQYEEDLATLRAAYHEQGRPEVCNFVGGRTEFKKILSDLKIYLSNDRRLRLFLAMDLDGDGLVTKKELDIVLSQPAAELVEAARSRSKRTFSPRDLQEASMMRSKSAL